MERPVQVLPTPLITSAPPSRQEYHGSASLPHEVRRRAKAAARGCLLSKQVHYQKVDGESDSRESPDSVAAVSSEALAQPALLLCVDTWSEQRRSTTRGRHKRAKYDAVDELDWAFHDDEIVEASWAFMQEQDPQEEEEDAEPEPEPEPIATGGGGGGPLPSPSCLTPEKARASTACDIAVRNNETSAEAVQDAWEADARATHRASERRTVDDATSAAHATTAHATTAHATTAHATTAPLFTAYAPAASGRRSDGRRRIAISFTSERERKKCSGGNARADSMCLEELLADLPYDSSDLNSAHSSRSATPMSAGMCTSNKTTSISLRTLRLAEVLDRLRHEGGDQ